MPCVTEVWIWMFGKVVPGTLIAAGSAQKTISEVKKGFPDQNVCPIDSFIGVAYVLVKKQARLRQANGPIWAIPLLE